MGRRSRRQGGRVLFCYADCNRASIWALFVDPQHEGLRLGKGPLALAVSWLFELGHQRVTLGTTPGTQADRFYAAQGWTRIPHVGAEVEYVLARPTSSLT